MLARIGTGDRLIIAFTRETTADTTPVLSSNVPDQTATIGTTYSITLPAATGGNAPLTYSVSGDPSWLSFNAPTRLLSGTPTADATHTITYTVTDDDGDTDTDTFDILVNIAENTVPTVSFTTTASTVDGLSVTTITGTVTDPEDNDGDVVISANASLGTLSLPVNFEWHVVYDVDRARRDKYHAGHGHNSHSHRFRRFVRRG